MSNGNGSNKKTMGLICLLLNILLGLLTGFAVVGLGGVIYGATQKATDPSAEKFFKNGLIQLIASVAGLVLFYICTIASLGLGIVISWIFWPAAPIGFYVWSIVDAVNLYKHSQA